MDPVHRTGEAPTLPPAAIAALNEGRKIEGIKIVRQERRLGLKEAKGLVDDYEAVHPESRALRAGARSTASSGAWLREVVALGVAYLEWRLLG